MNEHDFCLLHHLCFSFAFVSLDPSLLCGLFFSKLGNPQEFLEYLNKQLYWLVLAGMGFSPAWVYKSSKVGLSPESDRGPESV